jgi:D-ribose pyranase
MKKKGILNPQISKVIASMGHRDLLTICDAGFPVPLEPERIDLTVVEGIPRFMDVLSAMAEELQVEKIYIAKETTEVSPKRYKEMKALFPDAEVELITHTKFMELSHKTRATIRTAEFTSYSNIILKSGVVY